MHQRTFFFELPLSLHPCVSSALADAVEMLIGRRCRKSAETRCKECSRNCTKTYIQQFASTADSCAARRPLMTVSAIRCNGSPPEFWHLPLRSYWIVARGMYIAGAAWEAQGFGAPHPPHTQLLHCSAQCCAAQCCVAQC